MSVLRGPQAVHELLHRLGAAPPNAAGVASPWELIEEMHPYVTTPLGGRTDPQTGSLWSRPETVHQLRDPEAYAEAATAALSRSRAAVFATQDAADIDEFCAASLDITMRGGTTSGVVYPLAVCELARTYRLRNVGGASAGAIAAAAAAAAEVGRCAEAAASNAPQSGAAANSGIPASAALEDSKRVDGHVRRGFAGFADCLAWLAQVDESGGQQFRVAQLFRPTQDILPIFRLLVAKMRGKLYAIPVLFVGAFGRLTQILNILVGLAALGLAGTWSGRHGGWVDHDHGSLLPGHAINPHGDAVIDVIGRYAVAIGEGTMALLGWLVGIVGLLALTMVIITGTSPAPPEETREPVVRAPRGGAKWPFPLVLVLLGAGLVTMSRCAFGEPWLHAGELAIFTLVAFVLVALLGILPVVMHAGRHSFGLVSGASPELGRSVWNVFAGMPKRTVTRPLVTWLSEVLSELAGLDPDKPLRFGHLWFGTTFQPGSGRTDDNMQAATDRRHRIINLELMTTELVQGLAYRFPLSPARNPGDVYDQLYVRRSDLEKAGADLFPTIVVDALCAAEAARNVFDRATGAPLSDLHPLPDPWDLPVIFAVRMSMALPVLLEAVRVYRLSGKPSHVRDDFGLPFVGANDEELVWPTPSTEVKVWAEELWFSDGGITSNFPIHLFDSLFPLWPTVGVTLGSYPPGFRQQDVRLPQDFEGTRVVGAPVGQGIPGFVGAIVGAARGWRDTAQSQLPAFVGRIATVRQSSDEGGTNLLMTRETIASLALRGELAGARLRRRFRSDWWRRNQWLRFRTSLTNLEQLRQTTADAARADVYASLASAGGAAELTKLRRLLVSGDPRTPEPAAWHEPSSGFWPAAASVINALASLAAAPDLAADPGLAEPELRQVPPV